jgi:hypothetical protein
MCAIVQSQFLEEDQAARVIKNSPQLAQCEIFAKLVAKLGLPM